MTIGTLLTHPAVQALGRALLHFLWQGALLAFLVWLIQRVASPSAARFRYGVASLIMLLMPIALILTATRRSPIEPRPAMRNTTSAPVASTTAPQAAVFYAPRANPSRPGLSGWVFCIWIGGVFLFSLRSLGGWSRAQRLKQRAELAGAELRQLISPLALALRISAPFRLCTSAVVQVPTVIGWLRPYILLPVTAIAGLTESQIRAILAHELAHIRRHDYIVNLAQTAIETVLFYHPAVWWVGKQMRIEREHCCDDIAVAVCGDAVEYATALAELEEIRGQIPEAALAATGGDLLGRIRRLLGEQDRDSRSLGTVAAAGLLLFIASIVVLHAAPQEPQPKFDVASIKPNAGGGPGPRYRMRPQFSVESATLKDLVTMAYDVKDFQVSGGPGWINADRYNIEAKAEAMPSASNQELRLLQERRLQALLQDRFKLKIHRETKQLPIYELIVAKGGPKLQSASCIQRDPGDTTPPAPGKTFRDYCGFGGFGRGAYEATSATMADFAYFLPIAVGRTVVDKTGITGTFHIRMTFVPDEGIRQLQGPPGDPAAASDAGPSIFTAIQEQLGLKLESAKGPVEVLIIDGVEKPSEN